jgi:hypothetical protein
MVRERYGWVVLGCSVAAALAAVSWFLGGNTVWLVETVLSAGVLVVLVVLASLKPLEQARARDWFLLGWLVLGWACWAGVGYFLPLSTVTIKPDSDEPAGPTRITYDQNPVATLDPLPTYSFRFRGRFHPDLLTLQTLGPQGWQARTFRAYDDNDVRLESVPTTSLYIDNRGHGATRLECGKLGLDVAAGAAVRRRVLASPWGGEVAVRVDGKEVGTLGDKPVLVDVLGTRSYRLREVVYGAGLLEALQAVGEMHGHFPEPAAPDTVYEHKHVHQLPGPVDFFLEAAPQKIEVATFGAPAVRETRRELREVE